MARRSEEIVTNAQPRLIGFLCEKGAYVFYDVSNPVRRKLPANFVGLPVASISQVRASEVLKAFLSGAEGVLIAGCEVCALHQDRQQIAKRYSEIVRELIRAGIDRQRLQLEWISANEEEKFFHVVNAMMENLRRMEPLRLSAETRKKIAYCG
jgi:F420-non-reducing hydrogenase iron-sulfur subunit